MHFLNTRKVLLLTTLVFIFVLSIVPLALAAGYNDPQQYPKSAQWQQGPHGGYITSTNKCKECHAVHLATGSYMLTRVDKRNETCNYCHGVGGPWLSTLVTLNEQGHGLSATQESSTTVVAPDDTAPTYKIHPSRWACLECHSVHDSNTVLLAGLSTTKLLRNDPNPGKSYKYYTVPATKETTQTLSHWCSTCHNANFGLHAEAKQYDDGSGVLRTAYGHDSSGEGVATDTATGKVIVDPLNTSTNLALRQPDGSYRKNAGPTCKQCHSNGGFPHSSESTPTPDMLEAGTQPNALDPVCSKCHETASLP